MGTYDTIWFDCPHCGTGLFAQSKSGPCVLWEYYNDKVPVDVAADANRHAPHECHVCSKKWELEADPVEYIYLEPVKYEEI